MKTDLFEDVCRLVPWKRLKAGTFRPRSPTFTEIPKTHGGKRPLAHLSEEDEILCAAVTRVVAERLDPFLSDNVYAQRLVSRNGASRLLTHRNLENKDEEKWNEKKWYRHFAAVGESWIKDGYRFVAVTDVASFAERIPHDRLLSFIGKKISDARFLELLSTILGAWSYSRRKDRGLPQPYALTYVLGNAYLIPLDQLLRRQEKSGRLRYVRFMDDIWTFSKTLSGAQRAQQLIRKKLKQLNLRIHPKKTKIYRPHEILAITRQRRAPHG